MIRQIVYLIPLSVIGLWRWTVWLARKIGSQFYKPLPPLSPKVKRQSVSVVVPVYNEDLDVFLRAIDSWIDSGVFEIITVIDQSNIRHIVCYKQHYLHRKDVKCQMIITKKPGKRPALADGVAVAKGDIIALVDSDTIWSKRVLDYTLPYFQNSQIGGVSTQQRVERPHKLAQVLFDILLWSRYNEELPFLLGTGKVINTLSGRTALYRREALLNSNFDNLHHLTHEYYHKSRCISGDDKRLTHLILEQGWLTTYARDAIVYTPGEANLRVFLKQRLRWTRNSWRADSRAFKRGWVLKHPALAYFNFDRFIQPIFMLIGPIVFAISIYQQNWLVTCSLLVWWCLSRFIRLFGYFKRYPARLRFLPAYIVFSYYTAVLKIYAWTTIFEQGWITRWDKKRLKRTHRTSKIIGLGLTTAVLYFIYVATNTVHISVKNTVAKSIETTKPQPEIKLQLPIATPTDHVPLPRDAVTVATLKSHTIKAGDSLDVIARQNQTTIERLRFVNRLEDNAILRVGQIIYF